MFRTGKMWLAALAAMLTLIGVVATAAADIADPISVTATDAPGNIDGNELDGVVAVTNTTGAVGVHFVPIDAVDNSADDVATMQLHTLADDTELAHIQGPASAPTMADVPIAASPPEGTVITVNIGAVDNPHCVVREERRGIGIVDTTELFRWQVAPDDTDQPDNSNRDNSGGTDSMPNDAPEVRQLGMVDRGFGTGQ